MISGGLATIPEDRHSFLRDKHLITNSVVNIDYSPDSSELSHTANNNKDFIL